MADRDDDLPDDLDRDLEDDDEDEGPLEDIDREPCRLYLITPPRLDDLGAFAATLARALDAGDVAALQIRLKDVDDDTVRRTVEALLPVAQDREVAVILNDRPDLAHATGCDGVHVGQDDTPYREARKIMGPDAIVGVTSHDSRHLAMLAAEEGADYVAFGAFYPTLTKEPKAQAEIGILEWWQSMMTVPCVAIGGITPANAEPLIRAGADFLAVSSGVWTWPEGPEAAVRELNRLMGRDA
ncbi:thiamine phosphate synthase [Caenispirillum bisanense]|uniref:Thiamine-phosphate synthase n=1 Tax=Caenispirillum bisanense TaxID=414052 RepID=A0A286GR57_9PROT|nr:thiamine phosphate synthase [Caenispirillum bisanense]SOD97656.1 thiamine-phosphate diphosphorylase [Caenispirillum bisanense]